MEIHERYEGDRVEVLEEEVRATWQGLRVSATHRWKEAQEDGTGKWREAELEALVVRSQELERSKRKSLERTAAKEQAGLEMLAKSVEKRDFSARPTPPKPASWRCGAS